VAQRGLSSPAGTDTETAAPHGQRRSEDDERQQRDGDKRQLLEVGVRVEGSKRRIDVLIWCTLVYHKETKDGLSGGSRVV